MEISAVESVLKKIEDQDNRAGLMKTGGGRFVKPDRRNETDDARFEKEKFIDSGNFKADYQSFVMNVILYKLTRILGFDTALLMS